MANEWNELQTVRRISPVLQLLAALLLLQVRLESAATAAWGSLEEERKIYLFKGCLKEINKEINK